MATHFDQAKIDYFRKFGKLFHRSLEHSETVGAIRTQACVQVAGVFINFLLALWTTMFFILLSASETVSFRHNFETRTPKSW